MSDFYDWFEGAYESEHVEDGNWQNHKLKGVEIAGSSADSGIVAEARQTIEDACFVAWDERQRTVNSLQSRLEKAEQENKVLRECVEFYGDADTKWFKRSCCSDKGFTCIDDTDYEQMGNCKIGGKTARQALSKIKEIKERG